jgi:hypothetical protein
MAKGNIPPAQSVDGQRRLPMPPRTNCGRGNRVLSRKSRITRVFAVLQEFFTVVAVSPARSPLHDIAANPQVTIK